MEIKIQRICKDIELPKVAYQDDAAFDLRSSVDDVLKPGEKKAIPTGLRVAIPPKHVGLIKDRSSIAFYHTAHTMAGVIDPGYRGEIKVLMINLSEKDFKVEKGMRIAQMLVQPIVVPDLVEVDSLDETARGEGGYGSSGGYGSVKK